MQRLTYLRQKSTIERLSTTERCINYRNIRESSFFLLTYIEIALNDFEYLLTLLVC